MGIYDRDYVGADRPRRGYTPGLGAGFRPPRMWSGNAWIIAICIAVALLDAVIGQRVVTPVTTGRTFFERVPEAARARAVVNDDSLLSLGELVPDEREYLGELPGSRALGIVDPDTGLRVGMERVLIMSPVQAIGHFSTGKGFRQLEVWRLVTFQFLHANVTHLFFNMLGLFFFGAIVEQRLGRRLYLAFYLACGIFGAIMYLLLNLLGQLPINLPGLLVGNVFTPLIGASAGVFGVLMAAARLSPNAKVLFMFFIPMRLSTMIYLLVGIAAFTLITSGPNAGGEAAHIGGAIAGWFFINNAHLLSDFFDVFGPRRPRPGKPVSPTRERKRQSKRAAADERLDRILAKVSNEGMHSLTKKERRILNQASKAKRD